MNTPQHRRLFQGSANYLDYVKRFIDPALWFKMDELGGIITFNYGNLALPFVQLCADGSMEAVGVGAWTATDATLTKELGTPHSGLQVLRIAKTGVNPSAKQAIMTVGKNYYITGVARSNGTAVPCAGSGLATVWTGTTSVNWQPFAFVITTTSANIALAISSGAGWVEFDDVTCSESGYDGTPATCTPAQPGKRGPTDAYLFDGANSKITIPNGAYANFPSMTLGMLARITAAGEAGSGRLFDCSAAASLSMITNGAGTLSMSRATAGASTSTTNWTAAVWKWYFATYNMFDGVKKPRMYIGYNGTVNEVAYASQVAISALLDLSAQVFVIGNRVGIDRTYNGLMDEFLLCNRELPMPEMINLTRLTNV